MPIKLAKRPMAVSPNQPIARDNAAAKTLLTAKDSLMKAGALSKSAIF